MGYQKKIHELHELFRVSSGLDFGVKLKAIHELTRNPRTVG